MFSPVLAMSRSKRPWKPRIQRASRPENVKTAIANRSGRAAAKNRRRESDELLMANARANQAAHERLVARRAAIARQEAENRRHQP